MYGTFSSSSANLSQSLSNQQLSRLPSSGTMPSLKRYNTLCESILFSLSLVLNLPLLLQYLLYSEHVLILILFPVQNREQFVVPEVVPWSKVADALGYYFLAHTGRGLTHQNLDYLGRKLLGVGGCG